METKQVISTIKENATQKGYTYTYVTGGSHGFPMPELGVLVHGFDAFAQAELFRDENHSAGEISMGFARDGWNMCEIRGTVFEAMEPNLDDYGYDYKLVSDFESLENEAYRIYNELRETGCEDADEIEAAKEFGDNLMEAAKDINWDTHSLILCQGEYYESVAKEQMSFSHDTKNYFIGVYYSYEEINYQLEEENEENND